MHWFNASNHEHSPLMQCFNTYYLLTPKSEFWNNWPSKPSPPVNGSSSSMCSLSSSLLFQSHVKDICEAATAAIYSFIHSIRKKCDILKFESNYFLKSLTMCHIVIASFMEPELQHFVCPILLNKESWNHCKCKFLWDVFLLQERIFGAQLFT